METVWFARRCNDSDAVFSIPRKMSQYQQGKNWSAEGGVFYNGHGKPIEDPKRYFAAVAQNRYDYNATYANGQGKEISNPTGYFKAVAEDRYGYNSRR